jgi:hypothetical protein
MTVKMVLLESLGAKRSESASTADYNKCQKCENKFNELCVGEQARNVCGCEKHLRSEISFHVIQLN